MSDDGRYVLVSEERRVTHHATQQEGRLRAIELGMTELSTVKKLVGALVAVGLPAAGAFVYQAVASTTRQSVVEDQVKAQAAQLDETNRVLGNLQTELRVLIAETRSAEQQRQVRDRELAERLQRLETRIEQRGGAR